MKDNKKHNKDIFIFWVWFGVSWDLHTLLKNTIRVEILVIFSLKFVMKFGDAQNLIIFNLIYQRSLITHLQPNVCDVCCKDIQNSYSWSQNLGLNFVIKEFWGKRIMQLNEIQIYYWIGNDVKNGECDNLLIDRIILRKKYLYLILELRYFLTGVVSDMCVYEKNKKGMIPPWNRHCFSNYHLCMSYLEW